MTASVHEYVGLSGLRALEGPWKSILARLGPTDYYLDYDWFYTFCRHAFIGVEEQRLRFFAVTEADDVTAIVPLELRVERIRRVPFRIWALVGSRGGDIFMTAAAAEFPALDPASGARALAALHGHLLQARPRAGLLLMGRMSAQGIAHGSCAAISRFIAKRYTRGGFEVIPTTRPFSDLLAGLDGKFRRNLRSRRERLAREAELSVEAHPAGSPAFEKAYTEFVAVEGSGWKGAEGTRTAIAHNQVQRSFLASLNAFDGDIRPEIYLLRLGNRCIAAQYWLRSPTALANFKMGYDESLRKFSPGHQLLASVIERACEDPAIQEVNLVSTQAWHADWRPEFRPHLWHYYRVGAFRSFASSALLRLPRRTDLREPSR